MSNLTTFEVLLESAASDVKYATKEFNSEIESLNKRTARLVENTFGTQSKISDLGFVQSAVTAATEAGARFSTAVASLKQLHYVGRMMQMLTDERFTEVTKLDANTYLAIPK